MSIETNSTNSEKLSFSGWLKARFFGMSRLTKRVILCACDVFVFSASLWLSMALRYGTTSFPRDERLDGLYFVLPLVGLAAYWFLGLYRSMLRSMESRTIIVIAAGAVLTALLIPTWSFFDTKLLVPRSVPFTYALFVIGGVGSVRLFLREIYQALSSQSSNAQKVIIYGAGVVGTQLAAFLANAPDYRIMAFVDDNPKLEGAKVRGHRIFPVSNIPALLQRYEFQQIILAMNDISASRQRRIVQRLADYGVPIKTVPPITDMLRGDAEINNLKPIRIEDLLGRQTVAPIEGLIESGIEGKNIFVTGAAGSIGSEICKQLVKAKPARIVAYDVSEFGLYSFEREMQKANPGHPVEVITKLGSVLDRARIRTIIKKCEIDIVYHAAAYKHVPIVENNVLIAVENNAFGSKTVAEEAIAAGVERFILISTDKAVRPTSVMGASKRVAELIVQNLQTGSSNTVLSMVRFGNVLGSSGSVIPLFNEQIANGGPVTLTHKDVTRYFMTISEAAQLVLQAGQLATGGEVFVLDMGEPVKLIDLARLMIQLSGNTVLQEGDQGDGIEIEEIGLRPGEKLYEELLIGDNVSGTQHPKIMRAMETKLSPAKIKKLLADIRRAIDDSESEDAVALLQKSVNLKADAF